MLNKINTAYNKKFLLNLRIDSPILRKRPAAFISVYLKFASNRNEFYTFDLCYGF